MKTVLLHGLGQNAESWKALTDALGTQDILCPDLWKLMEGTDCTYPNLYRAFPNTANPFWNRFNCVAIPSEACLR